MNLDGITYQHGPFVEHKAENRRMAPVLDALATIAVSEPKHEVIAVALRLTVSETELIISGTPGYRMRLSSSFRPCGRN